jgi:hypothetical protein
MNVATTFTALAELCEQADGPSLDLDHAIHDMFPDGDGAPLYTGYIDAAMMLVPERSWIRMDQWPSDFCSPVASVQPIREPKVDAHVGTGSTLPLALCAAALRAQEQSA